jgi:hypothetical protein
MVYMWGTSNNYGVVQILTNAGAAVKTMFVKGNEGTFSQVNGLDVVGSRMLVYGQMFGTKLVEAGGPEKAFLASYSNLGILIALRTWFGPNTQVYPYLFAASLLGNGSIAALLSVSRYDNVPHSLRLLLYSAALALMADRAILSSSNSMQFRDGVPTPSGAAADGRVYNGQANSYPSYYYSYYANLYQYYNALNFASESSSYDYYNAYYNYYYYYAYYAGVPTTERPISQVSTGQTPRTGGSYATAVAYRHDLQLRPDRNLLAGAGSVAVTLTDTTASLADKVFHVTVKADSAIYAGPVDFKVIIPKGSQFTVFNLALKAGTVPQPVVIRVESEKFETGGTVVVVNPK